MLLKCHAKWIFEVAFLLERYVKFYKNKSPFKIEENKYTSSDMVA